MSKVNTTIYVALIAFCAIGFWLTSVKAQEIVVIDEGAYFDEKFATSSLSYEKQEELAFIERKNDLLIAEQKRTNFLLERILEKL